jgi:hypothetical protein
MALKDAIKNGKLSYPNRLVNVSNAPEGTRPNDTSIEPISALYYEEIGKYASNVFDAEIQGLNGDDWYAWTSVRLRSSDVINPTTGDHLDNTWQKILILDRNIDYVPIGAYVKYNGAIWIVFNPSDVAATSGTAIVQRCNTTYNQYDYYNNIIKTPMAYAKGLELAGSPYYSEYMALPSGYTHVTLQLNDDTREIHNNTRLILGDTAYAFHGLVNFANEYTMNDESCHIIRSDIRTIETIPDDDMENRVASGLPKKIMIKIVSQSQMEINSEQALKIHAYRHGERIEYDPEHPFDYIATSSDETVIKLEKREDGEYYLTAFGIGSSVISVTLVQNPNITTEMEITVPNSGVLLADQPETPQPDYLPVGSLYYTPDGEEPGRFYFYQDRHPDNPEPGGNLEFKEVDSVKVLDWIGDFPTTMNVFDTAIIEAGLFINGECSADEVYYMFTGANSNSYSAQITGNRIELTVYVADTIPLTITAYCGDLSVSREIRIVGF